MTDNAMVESKINRQMAGTMMLGDRGIELANLDQILELAKMMAISGPAVPKHLRGQPGVCLGVIVQAARMGLDPFAAAAKSYVVNDQLAYESQLFSAMANTHPTFKHRPEAVFEGEGGNRRCTITGHFRDGTVRQYTSPRFADISPKNSPLWKSDPDQQLFYMSMRAFIRRWCPEIMLGIKDAEELREAAMTDITPAKGDDDRKPAPKSLDDFAAATAAMVEQEHSGSVSLADPDPASEESGSAPVDSPPLDIRPTLPLT